MGKITKLYSTIYDDPLTFFFWKNIYIYAKYTDSVKEICREYYKKIGQLESTKYDLEYEVYRKTNEARLKFFFFLNK